MKKIIFLFILFSIPAAYALAQTDGSILSIDSLHIAGDGKQVEISFIAKSGKNAVKNTYTAIFFPVVVEDEEVIASFKPIVVEGKRAEISRQRSRTEASIPANVYTMRNDEQIHYKATIAMEKVNPNAQLLLKGKITGCCSAALTQELILAYRFMWEEKIVVEPVYDEIKPTSGDILSDQYKFVVPLVDFERQSEVGRDEFVQDNRGLSPTIYFRQGKRILDKGFRNNRASLDSIVYAVNSLTKAKDAKVSHIVVAGFASPEGTFEFNQKLAYDRAMALRDYIIKETDIDENILDVYNGGIDWQGLKHIVGDSDLPEKAEVLNIIDNYPIWDPVQAQGRHGMLMRLNNGDTYRKLLDDFFPELRNTAYIRVYYENLDD